MTKNNSRYSVSRVKERLLEVINNMSEKEHRELLAVLNENRQYPRKLHIMDVDYQIGNKTYGDFIFDISKGGVFIETINSFAIGQKMSLDFSSRDLRKLLQVDGEIAWQGPQGVGVRFTDLNEQQRDIIQMFLKNL